MKTAYDEEIKIGSLVKSTLFNGGEFTCIKIDDEYVYLCGDKIGDSPLKLNQETLDKSHWKISGFRKL